MNEDLTVGNACLRPRPAPGMQIEVMEGEGILYHPAHNQVTHLNRSAVLVWQLCDGTRRVEEIVALLAAAYPESTAAIARDVHATVDQLLRLGCLQAEEAGHGGH